MALGSAHLRMHSMRHALHQQLHNFRISFGANDSKCKWTWSRPKWNKFYKCETRSCPPTAIHRIGMKLTHYHVRVLFAPMLIAAKSVDWNWDFPNRWAADGQGYQMNRNWVIMRDVFAFTSPRSRTHTRTIHNERLFVNTFPTDTIIAATGWWWERNVSLSTAHRTAQRITSLMLHHVQSHVFYVSGAASLRFEYRSVSVAQKQNVAFEMFTAAVWRRTLGAYETN